MENTQPTSLQEEVDTLSAEDIHYSDQNPSNSETVIVFIHSFSADHSRFENIYDELKNYYRVIGYDLPGHGKTKRVKDCSYSLKENAHHLKTLLEHLKVSKAHILGHSLGGKIALEF